MGIRKRQERIKRVLDKEFFERDTLLVARELIGKFLVTNLTGKPVGYMITEAEAYDGPKDLASHGAKGITPRTKVMFGKAGHIYVYLIYGMYEMLNIVTGPKGYPAGVLIRGIEGISGPGRLTRALGITRVFNAKPVSKKTGLWIEDRGILIDPKQIKRTPRIGVEYAGSTWALKPYRFILTK